ncbi:MAG TPA: hypothetical protein VGF31_04305, partial [Myxococcaceae bacterium]
MLAKDSQRKQEEVVEVHRALGLERPLVEREDLGRGELRVAGGVSAGRGGPAEFFARLMAVRMRRGSKSVFPSMERSRSARWTRAIWSEMSAMANRLGQPRRWTCSRSTSAPKAWKVQTVSACARDPTSRATRSFISAAALLVKVTARMARGGTRRWRSQA